MNDTYQKQLQIGGWVLVVVLILGAVWLLQSIDQMHRTGNVGDTFSVSGTGKVEASPDIAVADIAISVENLTAKTAQTEASKKSNSVVDYLKKAGIKDSDIKTSGYNIFPQYDYSNGRNSIRGYQVTQSLTVKIRDMDKANTILDGVVSAGANQVNGLRFDVDEPEKLRSEARKKAIENANEKAQELRDQLGVGLGKIVSFSESGDASPPIMYGMGGGGVKAADSVAPAPALPTGTNEIIVNVTITYQIQ